MSRLVLVAFAVLFAAGSALWAAPAPEAPKVPRELLELRRDAAQVTYEQTLQRVRGANGIPLELPEWSRRWLEAEKALSNKKDDQLKALQAHLERMKLVERMALGYARMGQGRPSDATAATYYRLEAEVWLLQAGGKLPKKNKLLAEEDGNSYLRNLKEHRTPEPLRFKEGKKPPPEKEELRAKPGPDKGEPLGAPKKEPLPPPREKKPS